VVYKGKWRGGEVAIKQMPVSELSGKELEEFKGEAALMSKLRPHTNVVQFIGACIRPGEPLCILTEYLDGGSLLNMLKKKTLTGEDLIKIARGIAAGMLHLVSENIVHRDLAARNILLSLNLVPKVADFGLSRLSERADNSSFTATTVGPLRWMSPESLSDRCYSEKTDVWSFGVLLFELMTYGELPYPQVTDPVVVATNVAMRKLKLTAPASAPDLLQSIMSLCLKFDPEDRPTFKVIISQFPSL